MKLCGTETEKVNQKANKEEVRDFGHHCGAEEIKSRIQDSQREGTLQACHAPN